MMYMQEKQTTVIENSETTETSNIYIYILLIYNNNSIYYYYPQITYIRYKISYNTYIYTKSWQRLIPNLYELHLIMTFVL